MIDPSQIRRCRRRLGEVETEMSRRGVERDSKAWHALVSERDRLKSICDLADQIDEYRSRSRRSKDSLADASDIEDLVQYWTTEITDLDGWMIPTLERRLLSKLPPPENT